MWFRSFWAMSAGGNAFYAYGTSVTPGALSGSPTRNLPAKHADMLRKACFSVFAP
jgi:hypothetical protein